MLELTFAKANDPIETFHSFYLQFLYELLGERLDEPDTNISHTKMPTWQQHIEFVQGGSNYKIHCVVCNARARRECIGVVYLTQDNEIGVHIARGHRGRGYGCWAIKGLLALCDSDPDSDAVFYANINPKNKRSIDLFKWLGFKKQDKTKNPEDAEHPQITLAYSKKFAV